MGRHDEHDPAWGRIEQPPDTPPEFILIGGFTCPCGGECVNTLPALHPFCFKHMAFHECDWEPSSEPPRFDIER